MQAFFAGAAKFSLGEVLLTGERDARDDVNDRAATRVRCLTSAPRLRSQLAGAAAGAACATAIAAAAASAPAANTGG